MNWKLSGLLVICALDLRAASADACGMKLTVNSSSPRRAVARTSNPSQILLLGDPPSRLRRDLTAAGHHVDIAASASVAKQEPYAVVITDAGHQDGVRSAFPNAIIVVRSGDIDRDIHSVETVVMRQPIRADQSRTVVAARMTRTPIAAGPPQTAARHLVDARPKPEETAVAAPPPVPERVETTVPEPKLTETQPASSTPSSKVVETRPAVIASNTALGEIYFSLGVSKGSRNATLDAVARKLKKAPDVQVTVEGYADPSGNHDDNMALSQKRAEWVRDYLTAAGIDQGRLEVASYGDTHLKYGAADGRNRRVAVVAK